MGKNNNWQDAFIEYSFDAAVGRLFRGLIHNMNGVGQAFSMQSELLVMMYDQAQKSLEIIEKSDSIEEARENAGVLKDMMTKRSGLTEHLIKEVHVLHDIMRRCTSLMEERRDPSRIHAFKLRDIIRIEVEFLNADSFFKHKVKKELVLAENIPAFSSHQIGLHKILAVLLENASQAMERTTVPEGESPRLRITSSRVDSEIRIDIEDNGPGIDAGLQQDIFAPFVSGFARTGLGLFLARKMATEFNGSISVVSSPGKTCFTLLLPIEEVTIG